MKKVSLSIFTALTMFLLLSFSPITLTPPPDLVLDLDPSTIQWTEDGDIEEGTIYTDRLVYNAERGGYDRVAVGVEFCPGRGAKCQVIYVDGAGTTVVLNAKKTKGGPDYTCD